MLLGQVVAAFQLVPGPLASLYYRSRGSLGSAVFTTVCVPEPPDWLMVSGVSTRGGMRARIPGRTLD